MGEARAQMDSIFNGYVAGCLIHALEATGVLESISERGPQSAEELSRALAIVNLADFVAVLRAAAWLGILQWTDDGKIALGSPDVASVSGFFTWLVGGYGEMLGQLPGVLTGSKALGVDVGRQESAVARGAGRVGSTLVRPELERALEALRFQRVVDLGCGDGSRLIELARSDPRLSGTGIEISADAALLAKSKVEAAGLAERLHIVHGNALTGTERIECDLVMSFFLLHDLVNFCGSMEAVFDALRSRYSARRYVFADTVTGDTRSSPPMFAVAFELVHGLMKVPVHNRSDYELGFHRSGVEVEAVSRVGTPNSWLWILKDCNA